MSTNPHLSFSHLPHLPSETARFLLIPCKSGLLTLENVSKKALNTVVLPQLIYQLNSVQRLPVYNLGSQLRCSFLQEAILDASKTQLSLLSPPRPQGPRQGPAPAQPCLPCGGATQPVFVERMGCFHSTDTWTPRVCTCFPRPGLSKRSNKRIWMDWDSNGQTSDWIERPQNEQGTFGTEAVDCSLFVQHHKCLPKKKSKKTTQQQLHAVTKQYLSWVHLRENSVEPQVEVWLVILRQQLLIERVTFWSQRYFLSSLYCHFGSQ